MTSIDLGIDKETLFERLGYKPHSGQQLFHDSTAKHRIPCCGRRWGKSLMVGNEMTAHLFAPDKVYWIVGPTYSLAEKEYRVLFGNVFRKLGLANDRRIRKSYNVDQGNMRVQFPWNTVLEVKSADKKDGLVGEGLDGVCVSEAALQDRDTWEMYIQPALLDKDGWAIFPSTPRGHNYYEGLWNLGQDPFFEEYESWRFPTWTNVASFPEGYDDPRIQAIKAQVSEFHWLQEYCAEFTALEGRIYTEFNRQIHVDDIEYNPAWKNYQAYDFGFADPFVCLDMMVDASQNVYVWREYQVSRLTTYEHGLALAARENPRGYHVDARFGDPSGADEMHTLALMLGPIIARSRNTPWIQGIEAIKRWLKIQKNGKPQLFIDRSCKDLIRQMEQLRSPSVREGRAAKEGQHDYDDHGPDALRYGMTELFVLRYQQGGLRDVYDLAPSGTEASSFFEYHERLLNEGIAPF